MKIIDRYIIRNFLGTLGFMLLLLSIIVVVIDVQQKSPRIESNGFQVGYFLTHYYPFWMIYLVLTFMSILVFISVIYFTSRLANNTEIVGIISSGASFNRFARPYFVTSVLLALLTLGINHFVLPWANVKKNALEPYTLAEDQKEKIQGNTEIATKIRPTEYVFINSYNRKERRGSSFLFQEFDGKRKLLHQISANDIVWDQAMKKFILNNFLEKKAGRDDAEILSSGEMRELSLGAPPEELFPDQLSAQTKTTPELLRFIQREKMKGNSNLNLYLNELYQRTSMPVSIIILSILALSMSSQKKRGGLGVNLAIGISLAFVFVFSFEVMKVVSDNKTLPPMLAMWLPNLVFAPITIWLYLKRANQ